MLYFNQEVHILYAFLRTSLLVCNLINVFLCFLESRNKLDLGFIMGASGNKADFDFNVQKQIVKTMVSLYDVSQEAVRVGVIVYGRNANLRIRLDSTRKNSASTVTAIDNLRLGTTGNNLQQALQLAKHYLFSKIYGGRPAVQKILIIFTTKPVQPGALVLAKELLGRGYKIANVAIGDDTRDQDGSNLSGRPDLALSVKTASEAPGAARVLTALLRSGNATFMKIFSFKPL